MSLLSSVSSASRSYSTPRSSASASDPFRSSSFGTRPASSASSGFSTTSSFEPRAASRPVGEPGFWSRLFGGQPRNQVRAPTEQTHQAVTADEAQRTEELARAQEQLVLNSGGRPVPFTNANGQTQMLSFTQVGSSAWRVTDAHQNSMVVNGREGLGSADLLRGAATFADYWSQYPSHLRDSTPRIDLYPGERRATFSTEGHGIMSLGMDDLDEMTFDHEFVGFSNDGNNGTVQGWDRAMAADGQSTSQYANNNAREDYAETWLAYIEARERGQEHVDALRRAFPNRVALIEQVYRGPAALLSEAARSSRA